MGVGNSGWDLNLQGTGTKRRRLDLGWIQGDKSEYKGDWRVCHFIDFKVKKVH